MTDPAGDSVAYCCDGLEGPCSDDHALPDSLRTLVVGTMCHCDDPDECDEHWRFFTNAEMSQSGGDRVRSACPLTEMEMRAIAALVARSARSSQ